MLYIMSYSLLIDKQTLVHERGDNKNLSRREFPYPYDLQI